MQGSVVLPVVRVFVFGELGKSKDTTKTEYFVP